MGYQAVDRGGMDNQAVVGGMDNQAVVGRSQAGLEGSPVDLGVLMVVGRTSSTNRKV